MNTQDLFDLIDDFTIDVPQSDLSFIPEIDETYTFQKSALLPILKGFQANRRVILQGLHGTGKTSHIEQAAARLGWPCFRINFDSHLTRMDLLGKDMIVLKEGKSVTTYQEGLLTWAIQQPIALILDEYDAGRPDTLFVIQRLLETNGQLTLLEDNRVIKPHPFFRLFATMNTLGAGDQSGLYQGTNSLNRGQLDRWDMFIHLPYLSSEDESQLVLKKVNHFEYKLSMSVIKQIVQFANLTREGFQNGELINFMSFRLLWSWVENIILFEDIFYALTVTYLNRCDAFERELIQEYYQRCFG